VSERDRFSLIGHAAMPLMNPLHAHELEALLDAASPRPDERVLDLGGGRGDLARLCVTRFACTATCVDRSPAACDAARERAGGLAVEVVCQDALTYVRTERPTGLGLVAALGALHAFGSGLPSWTTALDVLAPISRWALVGDLVAVGATAATEMDVATMAQLGPVLARAECRVELGPDRVLAYERAWCAAVDRFLVAHPGDPRSDWARERIAWSRSPRIEAAFGQLSFVALLVRGGGTPAGHRDKNA
jgi:SAM-dependent methyltransferase